MRTVSAAGVFSPEQPGGLQVSMVELQRAVECQTLGRALDLHRTRRQGWGQRHGVMFRREKTEKCERQTSRQTGRDTDRHADKQAGRKECKTNRTQRSNGEPGPQYGVPSYGQGPQHGAPSEGPRC